MPSSLARSTASRRPDARVHADQQLDARGRGLLDDLGAHAVAVPQAMRNVEGHPPASQLDGLLENDDGGDAIHVVVAAKEYLLALADGLDQTARPPPACP